MTPSSEATPRRERIDAYIKEAADFPDDIPASRLSVSAASGKHYEAHLLHGDVRFLVNSYDESRKLLREALPYLNLAFDEAERVAARIRAHLEAWK